MPQGFELTTEDILEVIAAYSSPQATIPSVAATPGWQVVGGFFLSDNVSCQLDAIASVTDDSLVCRLRLFDLTAVAEVSGSRAQTSETVPTRVLSGIVSIQGNRNYQIQAECTGGVADSLFAVVTTATITG